jgi:hypothetical protein
MATCSFGLWVKEVCLFLLQVSVEALSLGVSAPSFSFSGLEI